MADQQQMQQTEEQTENTSESSTQTSNSDQNILGNSAVQDALGLNSEEIPLSLNAPFDEVYERNKERTQNMHVGLTESQLRDMEVFVRNWEQNKSRYETVSAKTNMPAPLIAALHWRESSADFGTYLHQGDPLGRPAVHVPSNIPVFYVWEDAAVHALSMRSSKNVQEQLQMTSETRSPNSIATYAEAYNGLGYHNRNTASPYVFSGTDQYSTGKYVSDGEYSSGTVDSQIGVMALMGAIGGLSTEQDMSPQGITPEFAWNKVLQGKKVLRKGDSGLEVKALQSKLQQLGFDIGPLDGDFGNGTKRIVIEFQSQHDETPDGVVGKNTAGKLQTAVQNIPTASPTEESTLSIE